MSDDLIWNRIETEKMFCGRIAGKRLKGAGLEFVIYSDGRISGTADEQAFSGLWVWRDGFFCREAHMEDEDLGSDCEIIEVSGNLMRYTRNKGAGSFSIVEIGGELSTES